MSDASDFNNTLAQLVAAQTENIELRRTIQHLEQQILLLRGSSDETKMVGEVREEFDEYKRDCEEKMKTERAQLEAAKASLQAERVRTMAEKTIFEENVRFI